MGADYIGFFSCDGSHLGSAVGSAEAHLRALGWKRRVSSPSALVFTDARTRTAAFGRSGLLVGQLFSNSGQKVEAGSLQRCTSMESLLDHYWGEYVALEFIQHPVAKLRALRDPSGAVKCLYSRRDGFWIVTSNFALANSLGFIERSIDWDSVLGSLYFTHLRTERTCIRNLNELLPGCMLEIVHAMAMTRTAWSPWDFVAAPHRVSDPREAAAMVRQSVHTATRTLSNDRGRVMLELSGGLDSSIVAGCLQGGPSEVVCCTLTAPVPGTDERPYARLLAEQLGTDLHQSELSIQDARIDDPPSPNAVVPATGVLHRATDSALSEAAARHDVSAIFSGAGGDSIFCYLRNASPAADAWLERGLRGALTAITDLSTLHSCSVWTAAKLAVRKRIRGSRPPYAPDVSFLDRSLPAPPPPEHPWFSPAAESFPGDQERIFDLAGTQSYRDGMTRGERWPVRLPLLSQPVLEACLSTPSWMWIDQGRDRSVARAAFADLLPTRIRNRKSKGTYLNYCGAMYARHKSSMLDYLDGGALRSQGLVDIRAVENFIEAESDPGSLGFMRIFDLCMIESWARHQS